MIETNILDFLTMKRQELTKFLLKYKFAIQEIETKLKILNEELKTLNDYNPIENISSRLKTPESLLNKVNKKGIPFELNAIEESIRDIAGIRITCSFISDIYAVFEMLQKQTDVKIIEVKDYIKNPKPNGYQSLHLIVQIPVFLSEGTELVTAEIQIRTVAMDFWASLEHKIFYKYNKDVPERIKEELLSTALRSAELDRQMERLNIEVKAMKDQAKLEQTIINDDQWTKIQTHLRKVVQ